MHVFHYVYFKLFYTLNVFPMIFYIIYFKNLLDIENDFEVQYQTKNRVIQIKDILLICTYTFSCRKLNKCSDLTEHYAMLIVFFAQE